MKIHDIDDYNQNFNDMDLSNEIYETMKRDSKYLSVIFYIHTSGNLIVIEAPVMIGCLLLWLKVNLHRSFVCTVVHPQRI